MSGLPVLWHIEISHYNEKARWALDYKGVPHMRKAPFPGAHPLYAAWITRGRGRTLPVLEIDGRTIVDSTAIIAALEELHPEPPLYPADPADRSRALELEDYFDTEVGPEIRRVAFYHLLQDRDLAVDGVEQTHPARQKVLRATYPAMRRVVSLNYGVSRKRYDEALAKISAGLDLIEAEVGSSGYLVGDHFTVADLTAAALLGPATVPAQYPNAVRDVPPELGALRDGIRARPGGAWALEIYERHRGASVAVPA